MEKYQYARERNDIGSRLQSFNCKDQLFGNPDLLRISKYMQILLKQIIGNSMEIISNNDIKK